jgi:signal transduction histidine kinase
MAGREELDEPAFMLATEPPTLEQRRLALAVVAVVFAAFGIAVVIGLTAPFALIPVRIDAFVPVLAAILFVNDFITATLLLGQFSIIRSRALLVIAAAYFFTGLMAISFALTFPGVFSPTGLLGAGLQSSAWIYNFWHYGFPAAAIVYAALRGADGANNVSPGSTRSAIWWSVAIVISLVCGLTWLATAGEELLPHLFLDSIHPTPLARIVTSTNTFICALALALLYTRRRSVLDLWLMVVLCAWFTELALLDVLLFPRFTFGFYAGRGFSLVTSIVVLVVLLAEMTRLYARLAGSNISLQRERDNKLMNVEAITSSISHEIKQPLTAIEANGSAALLFLAHVPPNLCEVREGLSEIVSEGRRAREILDGIRALFGSADQERSPINVNEIILEALHILRGELKEHGIIARTELSLELPIVMGHEGQLREVIINLVRNAIEAMRTIKDRSRMVRVMTQLDGRDSITVAVQDAGPGIEPEQLERIFDAFVTTKPQGMGLGLAICRMIAERHGGQLSVRSDKKGGGALFQFILPLKSAAGATAVPH